MGLVIFYQGYARSIVRGVFVIVLGRPRLLLTEMKVIQSASLPLPRLSPCCKRLNKGLWDDVFGIFQELVVVMCCWACRSYRKYTVIVRRSQLQKKWLRHYTCSGNYRAYS